MFCVRLKMTKREELGPVPGENEKKGYVAVLKEAQEVENDFRGSTRRSHVAEEMRGLSLEGWGQ